MASQQMIDRLQSAVPGIPPSKKARLDSTNSETSGRPEPSVGRGRSKGGLACAIEAGRGGDKDGRRLCYL